MSRRAVDLLSFGRRCIQWLRVTGWGMFALFGSFAFAQAAKTELVVGRAPGAASDIGPLLLSPAQRRSLEAARNLSDKVDEAAQPRPSGNQALPDTLVLSGSVVRSGNRSTVWINDQPLYGRADANPLRTLAGQAGVLQPGATVMQAKARPGQVIDVPSGQVVDLLPPGSIRIIPPKVGGHKKEE
jgi:hypothetical protein